MAAGDIIKPDAEPPRRDLKRRFRYMGDGTWAEVVVLANADAFASFGADGNLEVPTTAKGVIMKSPDGKRWLTTVNNSGVLVTTALP